MPRKITRIAAAEVYNQPQLLHPNTMSNICAYIEKRNNGYVWDRTLENQAEKINEQLGYDSEGNWRCYTTENGVAVINIDGALTYKPTFWSALCGGVSYLDLQEAADSLAEDPSINTVVQIIDSGGGQAYGCFQTAQYFKDTIKGSGKRLITYVDGMMASAAYALGCNADEVIMNPDAQAGSIGVVVHLEDESEKKKMEGEKDIWIYAGDSKVPFAEDGTFKKEFLDDLQKGVDDTYEKFVNHVAEMRQLDTKTIKNTQAKVFRTEECISLGLADKSMTRVEFAEYLAELADTPIELEVTQSGQEEPCEPDAPEEDSGCGKKKKHKLEAEGATLEEQELSVETPVVTAEELAALRAQAAEAAQLKEIADKYQAMVAAQEEAAALAKEQELTAIKQNYKTVVASLGFVAEDNVEATAEALFKCREVLGDEASLLVDQLMNARNTIEEMKQHFCEEQGADVQETTVELSEQERALKSLDAKIANLVK